MMSARAKNIRKQRKSKGESTALLPAVSKRTPYVRTWNTFASPTPMGNTARSDNMVHHFVQTVEYGNLLTTSAGGAVFLGKSFVFSDLPQASSFTALFDQYKVDKIELWVYPTSTTANNQQTPVLWDLVIDYDDDNTPTTIAQLQNYTNCIEQSANCGAYVCFQPHVAQALYGGGVFTSFGNKPCGWIDSGSPGVRQYGIKMACTSAAVTYVFQVRARFHISTRNTF